MTEKTWESRGTVVLDGETYYIREVLETESYAPGTRFVSLSLVDVDSEEYTYERPYFGELYDDNTNWRVL